MTATAELTWEQTDVFDKAFAPAVPVLFTNVHKLAASLSAHLFNESGLCASIRCLPGLPDDTPNPYVLVLHRKHGSAPASSDVRLARAICRAYCAGINVAHCY